MRELHQRKSLLSAPPQWRQQCQGLPSLYLRLALVITSSGGKAKKDPADSHEG